MDKNICNIMKEKLKVIALKKKEVFQKILKSISQNNNITVATKIYANYIYMKKNRKNCFISKKHKICLYTGRRGGLFKNTNFSRIKFKNLIINNKFTNVKKNNW